MKKSRFKKKVKIAFWLLFLGGCAWIALSPRPHFAPPSSGITVKVAQPPASTPTAELEPTPQPKPEVPAAEEQTPPSAPVITVPVAPEKPEPVTVNGHPKIAIVIDDVGVDLKGSERAIRLPSYITLSFLPYAPRLHEQAQQAKNAGHELLLHMPMEPVGHEDPGPGALLVDLPKDELQQRFEGALESFAGFDGVNNHMGSKFTANTDGMTMVIDELQQHNLFFLDSRTTAQSVGRKIAEEKGLPVISRDVFLDDTQTPESIRAQLQETEHIAKRKGYAVAIGHPHTATMDVLPAWIEEAKKEGFDLVPLKILVKQ